MSESAWWKRAQARDEAAGSESGDLKSRVIEALRTVYDPEIPVNIYDLGLVYGLDVDAQEGRVEIRMTLTAPGCPVAQTFPATVEEAVFDVSGVNDVHVELVWDPPWSRERMSDAARLQLGML
ncbi:SUF system Fe-S cluster assembly protein [Paraburkholderia lacunae]|uniref:SUF system Fe-S cluster assembly protein n=1 Tax=Paraburkholderia lacunae TaxID=2211104 RepID=A0A370NDC5_9BURK|nr:SUF system Fe-S cluster assembly protein [Paraburkholderia lacunae]RDK03604.1 SUF system Fe-S cluster assembly protein [Paraburkholderia lacunae]